MNGAKLGEEVAWDVLLSFREPTRVRLGSRFSDDVIEVSSSGEARTSRDIAPANPAGPMAAMQSTGAIALDDSVTVDLTMAIHTLRCSVCSTDIELFRSTCLGCLKPIDWDRSWSAVTRVKEGDYVGAQKADLQRLLLPS